MIDHDGDTASSSFYKTNVGISIIHVEATNDGTPNVFLTIFLAVRKIPVGKD